MTIQLVLEKGAGKLLWGRVLHDENLLVDSASTLQVLEKKMRKFLKDFHHISDVTFDYASLPFSPTRKNDKPLV